MGVCLFPQDGKIDGPDACFSYREFATFRRILASEEGIVLGRMEGFGGDTPWTDGTTVFEPLINHPDDHGRDLSAEECRLITPRLEEVLSGHAMGTDLNSEKRNYVRQLSDLLTVLRVCVKKNVELGFM